MNNDYQLIVFSHLRWDFVYQRPQHLLSQIARHRPVVFIEEPLCDGSPEPRWELSTPADNVRVCRPCMPYVENLRYYSPADFDRPLQFPGFSDELMPVMKGMVSRRVEREGLEDYVVWLYTPMALPLAQMLTPIAVVYDCMDELSAFMQAPATLIEREASLLKWADVVFTGGPSLYKAKQGRHHNLHCFPSSVDAAHFRKALTIPEAADQASLARPRLGFFGVIDERMDLPLIDALAAAHPDWQIVMVGPVVKIEPEDLPQHPNLHYLGQRNYAELPAYLAGWDVCLLPFARNDATRFISPTKTLEYMAAERPIVSTPITDVAEPYGEIIYLGATPEEFIAACERALSEPEEARLARVAKMRRVLSQTSWDTTAQAMEQLIAEAVERRAPLGFEAAAAV